MTGDIIEEDLSNIISSNLPWTEFDGKTVVVSGANGFLPAYMVESILHLNEIEACQNIKVIGIVRSKEKAIKRFSKYHNRDDLRFIVQDICKPVSIDEKIDFVIHAASQASPKLYARDPVGTLCANVIGTNNLLNLAIHNNVEGFLFFSSSEVYGQVDPSQMELGETSYGYLDPTDIRSCYAESKRMGETMCISWFHQYGIPTKIVRPFHTYGPGMSLDDGRVFADFISDLLNNRDIALSSDGSAIRSFCYLADAVLGFFTILFNGICGQAYNIGNDKCTMRISDFADLISQLFPQKRLKVIKRSKGEDYLPSPFSRLCPDSSKARVLGWEPKYSLEDGLIRTIRWFEEVRSLNGV